MLFRSKKEAEQRNVQPEQLAHDLLAHALDESELELPSLDELVRQIRSTRKNENLSTLPNASLADALRSGPTDLSFNLEEWEAEWEKAEKELEQLNLNIN